MGPIQDALSVLKDSFHLLEWFGSEYIFWQCFADATDVLLLSATFRFFGRLFSIVVLRFLPRFFYRLQKMHTDTSPTSCC